MKHFDEKTLALFVLGAKEVQADRQAIFLHIKECKGCREMYRELSSYYKEFGKLQIIPSHAPMEVKEFRQRLIPERLVEGSNPLPARIVAYSTAIMRFFSHHPIYSAAALSSVALIILLLAVPLKPTKDLNPAYARAQNEFLVVYNNAGDVLWKRHVAAQFNFDRVFADNPNESVEDHIVASDVDGDARREVIVSYGWSATLPMVNSIDCYYPNGTQRWHFEFLKKIAFGGIPFPDNYLISQIMVGQFDSDGTADIVGIVHQVPDYPTAVIRLNGRHGTLVSEYWHSGYFSSLAPVTLSRNEYQDIAFAGENNGFNLACLLILDPHFISGHAPAPPKLSPDGIPAGAEKAYILFPRTDLAPFSNHPRNVASVSSQHVKGVMRVNVDELASTQTYGVTYYLDDMLKCEKIEFSDFFIAFHKRLESEGKLKRKLDDRYKLELMRGIQYWDGEKFTSTPTYNKRYLQLAER